MGIVTVSVAVADPPTVDTVLGVIVPVIAVGNPEMVKLTGSENPFSEFTVSVTLADWEALRVREFAEVLSVKSVMRTVSVVDSVLLPLDAVIVRGKDPTLAALVAVITSGTAIVASEFRNKNAGDPATVTPVGSPVT